VRGGFSRGRSFLGRRVLKASRKWEKMLGNASKGKNKKKKKKKEKKKTNAYRKDRFDAKVASFLP